MQSILGWLLPHLSARAMPDSGSVLPTSPRHQAAHAFVSTILLALIWILQCCIDSRPGKYMMLMRYYVAGPMYTCRASGRRMKTQVSMRMGLMSRSPM